MEFGVNTEQRFFCYMDLLVVVKLQLPRLYSKWILFFNQEQGLIKNQLNVEDLSKVLNSKRSVGGIDIDEADVAVVVEAGVSVGGD